MNTKKKTKKKTNKKTMMRKTNKHLFKFLKQFIIFLFIIFFILQFSNQLDNNNNKKSTSEDFIEIPSTIIENNKQYKLISEQCKINSECKKCTEEENQKFKMCLETNYIQKMKCNLIYQEKSTSKIENDKNTIKREAEKHQSCTLEYASYNSLYTYLFEVRLNLFY